MVAIVAPKQHSVEPVTPLTAAEAVKTLNYIDIQQMKREFGVTLKDADEQPEAVQYAIISILEHRRDPKIKLDDVKRMPLSAIQTYFTPEEAVMGESDEGKD